MLLVGLHGLFPVGQPNLGNGVSVFSGIVLVFVGLSWLLWCLLPLGPKQQDGIGMAFDLVFDSSDRLLFQWVLLPFCNCDLMDKLVLGLVRCVGNLLLNSSRY